MKQKLLLFTISIVIFLSSFSQQKNFLYYLDADFHSTTNGKAIVVGKGNMNDGLVKVLFYIAETNKLFMVANFTDSSMTVNHGLYQTFFANGKKEVEGSYVYNKQEEVWMKWDSLGHTIDSAIYEHGKKIMDFTYWYYSKGNIRMNSAEDTKADTLHRFAFDKKGNVVGEVNFKGQKGIITTTSDKGVQVDTVYTRNETEASFPGGPKAWNTFVVNIFRRNIDDLTKDNKSGTCRVRFIIDNDGKVSEVEALTMKGTLLADIVVRAIKNGPRWNPANQYGRPVKAYREQPVTFNISND